MKQNQPVICSLLNYWLHIFVKDTTNIIQLILLRCMILYKQKIQIYHQSNLYIIILVKVPADKSKIDTFYHKSLITDNICGKNSQ